MSDEKKIKQIEDRIVRAFKELGSAQNMRIFGKWLSEEIRKRTRMGYGVDKDGAEKKKLDKLATSTIKGRKNKELSNETTQRRSNLTESGKMLDSIDVTDARDFEVTISIKDEERKRVAGYHEEGNEKLPQRRFMHVSNLERKRLSDKIRKELMKLSRKR